MVDTSGSNGRNPLLRWLRTGKVPSASGPDGLELKFNPCHDPENSPDTPARRYNDGATGARPNQAPTLMRTMADGSKRPVKFDGVQNDFMIDRKSKVVDAPRARAQLMRQSSVLAEHRLIATWEVPTPVQHAKALKLFNKMKVANIKVRVVKP